MSASDRKDLETSLLKKGTIQYYHDDSRHFIEFSSPNIVREWRGDGGCFGGSCDEWEGTFEVVIGEPGSECEGKPLVKFNILEYAYSCTDYSDDYRAYSPGEKSKLLYFNWDAINNGTTRYENEAWKEPKSAKELDELRKAIARAEVPRNKLALSLQKDETFRFWHPQPNRAGSVLQFSKFVNDEPDDGFEGTIVCATLTGKDVKKGKKKNRICHEVLHRWGRWKIVDPSLDSAFGKNVPPAQRSSKANGGGDRAKASQKKDKIAESRMTAANGSRCFLKIEWMEEKLDDDNQNVGSELSPNPLPSYADEPLSGIFDDYTVKLKEPYVRCFYLSVDARRLVSIEDHGAERALQMVEELDKTFTTTISKDPRFVLASRLIKHYDWAKPLAASDEDIAALQKGSAPSTKECALLSDWTRSHEKLTFTGKETEGKNEEEAFKHFYHEMYGGWVDVPPTATKEQKNSQEGKEHADGFHLRDQFGVLCFAPDQANDADALASVTGGGRAVIVTERDDKLILPCTWRIVGGGDDKKGEQQQTPAPSVVFETDQNDKAWNQDFRGRVNSFTAWHRHPGSAAHKLSQGDKEIHEFMKNQIIGHRYAFIAGDQRIYNRLRKVQE